MSEVITVRWGDREVAVEMLQSRSRLREGHIGGVGLSCYAEDYWRAEIEAPEAMLIDGEGQTISFWGNGSSAQAALDKLAAKLREVREWIQRTEAAR